MNAKYKTTTEKLPRTLGRQVGALSFGQVAPLPPAHRRASSNERKILQRASSTGSVGSLRSQFTRREYGSISAKQQSTKRSVQSANKVLVPNSNVIDNGSAVSASAVPSSAGSQRSGSSRQGRQALNTSDILKLCLESEPSKVFEIDLHGKGLVYNPDFKTFQKLRILDLSGNFIKRISGLDSNKELRELKLYDNDISTIAGLEHLKELSILQLQHNKITSIGRGLCSLKKLRSLRLDNNQIVRLEVPELLSCSNITTLDLSHNRLDVLTPLSYLPNLEELFAAGNDIKNTGDLTKCKKLQEVDLSVNQISDLSGLANLPNLQILDISHNQLKTLESAGKLRSLEELNVNSNIIEELSSFGNQYPNLQILFACDNKISRWEEICSLSECLDLVELYVTDNPFTMEDGEMPDYHQTISQALPKLEVIDGVMLKKSNVKQDGTPLMRPMSASNSISIRQIGSQLKAATEECDSMFKTITERFDALRSLVESLPSEAPTPRTSGSIVNPTSSRCSSRSRLKEAKNFAAINFVDDDEKERETIDDSFSIA